jgi:uncharacterized RDD family membrane protein YckC
VINLGIAVGRILLADVEIFDNLDRSLRVAYMGSILSETRIISHLGNIWIWSEIIVILTNKRRRAIHDFIAGTVIVKTKYIEDIRKEMDKIVDIEI